MNETDRMKTLAIRRKVDIPAEVADNKETLYWLTD
jgi:hypothetical protein